MGRQLSFAECDQLLTQPGSPMETEEVIIRGQRTMVWKNLPPTFRDFILSCYQKYSDRVFVSSPAPLQGLVKSVQNEKDRLERRERLTFKETLERSLKLSAWMRQKGIKVGDRVGIGGINCSGWIVSWSAIHLIGAVPVCLNIWLPREQIIRAIKMVKASMVLLDEERAEILGLYARGQDKDLPPMYCWSESNCLLSIVELYDTPNDQGVHGVLSDKGLESLGPESDGMIFYSSGTSGLSKAVLSSQRAALSNAISGSMATARAYLRAGQPLPSAPKATDPQRTVLLSIPLFHVTGCLSWLLRAITNGSKLVTCRKWNVKEAIRLIQLENVNTIGGVPAVANQIIQSPDFPSKTTLDSVFYGGAPPSKQMAAKIQRKLPKALIIHGYGLTETNAVACALAGQDYLEKPESTGPPVSICQIRIVHPETRQELSIGQIGIILIKGANIMTCYYGNEEATREVFDENGWFDTGDVGYVDEDGCLYVKDRQKDLIIRGGENIASVDVENALTSHPHINEVAAVALPHPLFGEVVGAVVNLRKGGSGGMETTEKSIIEYVAPRLPRYAIPQLLLIWDEELPKNVNGKIMKNEIKQVAVEEWKKRGSEQAIAAKARL
ncbi:uncharacterized protein L203_102164 [Cryptococcus depauperatus CBS 7841]|uniref:Long-chain fatty acid CoA ligase n=1 Tax=Cryptococcus depauperatus CBS 7841 TaxID=1295531 RepID=A0AAJ8JRD8_9TREE